MSAPSTPATARSRRLVVAAVGVTVVAWASAFVAIRAAGEDLSPGPLSLMRLGVAAVILGIAVSVRREARPRGGEWRLIALCGVAWFGVYNLALNAGERRIDAGTAAMLVYVAPILIALLAGRLLGEGYPPRLLAGCAVSFAGVVVIGLATSAGVVIGAGVALCVLAAVLYAVGIVAQKPVLARRSSLSVTFWACASGLVVCVPFAPSLVDELGRASGASIAWSVYLGIAPTALAFTTWAYALARTTAGRMASASYLVPALAVLMGWLILDEAPAPLALAGGAIVLAGVVLAQRRPRRSRHARGDDRDGATPARRDDSAQTK